MNRIIGLYIVWLIATIMLSLAVTGRPAINLGYTPRTYSYPGRASRSHSGYTHNYYGHRTSFYTLLRWVCCAAFGYSAIVAFQMKRAAWAWIFGILAVLFNPLASFYLQRVTWQVVDSGAIGVIVFAAIAFWRDKGTAVKAFESTGGGWSKNGKH